MDWKKVVDKYSKRAVEYRRTIHRHPELGDEEKETSVFIVSILKEIGIEVRTGFGGYGVEGIIRGSKDNGKCIMLRADIDALPIQEETGLPFASEYPGKMHACGHDVHTAILLGAAHVLYECRDELEGTVKLFFQPAEETPTRGAIPSIEDGILQNPRVDAAVGLHVAPQLLTGQFNTRAGAMSAASARFNIIIKGKSGHAALPHMAVDSIAIAGEVLNGIWQVKSRKIDPLETCVITIGKIGGGTIYNQIAEEVKMEGTIRTFNLATMEEVHKNLDQMIKGITDAYGAGYEFEFILNSHPVINDKKMYETVQHVLESMVGAENAQYLPAPGTASEDFGSYSEMVPSCFYNLGCRKEGDPVIPPHNCRMVVDEDAIAYGMEAMVRIAEEYLRQK